MQYLDKKQLKSFEKWLTQQGSSIIATTNPYELLRFECKLGTGVLYTGKRGQSVSSEMVSNAIECWKSQTKWGGKGKPTRRNGGSKSKRDKLIERDGCECFFCGNEFKPTQLTLEHFVSLAQGGPNNMSNSVLACKPCNKAVDCMNVVDKVAYRDAQRAAQ